MKKLKETFKTNQNKEQKEVLMKKVLLAAAVGTAMLMAGMTSCINVSQQNTSEETGSIKKIDYQNYTSDYSIIVKNNSAKNLVCFKGSPRAENLISGVRAFDTVHLKNESSLFGSTSDFVLFCVTEEDYQANINNLSALDNTPFARIYSFYNTNTPNNTVYEISKYLGSECQVTLNNNTRYNIELRANSIHGDTIGYTQARTIKTTFSLVETDEIYVFPVFKKYDQNRGEIVSVYPKYNSGKATGEACYTRLVFDNETTSYTIDAKQWTDASNITFAHSAAYIRIINSSNVAVSVFNGSNSDELITQTGGKGIKSGGESIFTLNMPEKVGSGEEDFAYETSLSTSQIKIGDAMHQYFLTKDGNKPYTFEAGYEYTFVVKGPNIYDLDWDIDNILVEKLDF